jgi:hypothetical protein
MKLKNFSLSRRAMLQGSAAGAASLMLLPNQSAFASTGTEPDGTWKNKSDLLPPKGKYVFGVFAGTGENMEGVSDLLRNDVGLTTVYWKRIESPQSVVQRNLDNGIITRVELELTATFGGAGEQVQGLWRRIADGAYDTELATILTGLGPLASICHEADLAPDEEGGYQGVMAGTPHDFADMYRHVVTLARSRGLHTLWFFNTSFKVELWGENCTDEGSTGMYPGHNYVDFVGWDGFDWLGVPYHRPLAKERTKFGDMMMLFGRWDWYKRNFGERGTPTWRPLMIGETACCEADPPHQPADEWMDDMREWLHDHPDVTHVIWFSVLYQGSHDRRLTGGPQKQAGARKAGNDPLIAW